MVLKFARSPKAENVIRRIPDFTAKVLFRKLDASDYLDEVNVECELRKAKKGKY